MMGFRSANMAYLLVLFVCSSLLSRLVWAEYSELLTIRNTPMPNFLNFDFEFSHFEEIETLGKSDSFNFINFGHFPRDLAILYRRFGLKSLSFSLSQGHQIAKDLLPKGLLAVIEFQNELSSSHEEKSRLKSFFGVLSGMFCSSSLNRDFEHFLSRPSTAFGINRPYVIRLSREAVCTENLTPWIKQLPCHSQVISYIRCMNGNCFIVRLGFVVESLRDVR